MSEITLSKSQIKFVGQFKADLDKNFMLNPAPGELSQVPPCLGYLLQQLRVFLALDRLGRLQLFPLEGNKRS